MATQNLERHYPDETSWHSFRMTTVPELMPANTLVDPLSDPDEMRAYIRAFRPEYEISE